MVRRRTFKVRRRGARRTKKSRRGARRSRRRQLGGGSFWDDIFGNDDTARLNRLQDIGRQIPGVSEDDVRRYHGMLNQVRGRVQGLRNAFADTDDQDMMDNEEMTSGMGAMRYPGVASLHEMVMGGPTGRYGSMRPMTGERMGVSPY